MRTTFGDAATGLPENGMSGHLDMHERVHVNGNGDGSAAGTGMDQKDRAQGVAPANPKAQAGTQYPFGYGDAVEVLRLVQEFDAFASLELSIGDIHISVERKQPAAAQPSTPVADTPAAGHSTGPASASEASAASGAPAPAVSGTPAAPTQAAAAAPAPQNSGAPSGSAAGEPPAISATPAAAVAPMAPAAVPDADNANLEKIITPTLGVFYRRPSPEADPFVKEGDIINEGDQIGVLEVMKLYMPINSTVSGRIAKIVAQDAALVEHGEVLMLVEPV